MNILSLTLSLLGFQDGQLVGYVHGLDKFVTSTAIRYALPFSNPEYQCDSAGVELTSFSTTFSVNLIFDLDNRTRIDIIAGIDRSSYRSTLLT
ncbi:hypothetical protein M434DRAFT_29615 [Hypoxylon sp. CO27-5]|nr:hypothetical protein M434DRAFT_29615 [Hypoxylon sp. CO27-5]